MGNKYIPVIAGILVIFIGVFISTHLKLYDIYPSFDKLMHFSGGFVAAWFFFAWFRSDIRKLSSAKTAVVTAALVLVVGVLWEISEYLSSVYAAEYAPVLRYYLYIGTLGDTLADLVVDMLGAAVFIASALRLNSSKSSDA